MGGGQDCGRLADLLQKEQDRKPQVVVGEVRDGVRSVLVLAAKSEVGIRLELVRSAPKSDG